MFVELDLGFFRLLLVISRRRFFITNIDKQIQTNRQANRQVKKLYRYSRKDERKNKRKIKDLNIF